MHALAQELELTEHSSSLFVPLQICESFRILDSAILTTGFNHGKGKLHDFRIDIHARGFTFTVVID